MNNDTNITTSLQQNESLPMQIDQQHEAVVVKQKKKKQKCHGNQKLHHFKRKWLARGKTKQEIEELIKLRNNNNNNDNELNNSTDNNDNINNDVLSKNHSKKTKRKKQKNKNINQFNKRKRSQENNQQYNPAIVRSISQLSISQEQQQPLSKKFKANNEEKTINTSVLLPPSATVTNNKLM